MKTNTQNDYMTQFAKWYKEVRKQEYADNSLRIARAVFTGKVY